MPALHHRLLNAHLTYLADTPGDRLMVFMPPGSAKSTYTSVLFPPWYMSRNKGHSVLAASHTYGLAERFGLRARNLIEQHRNELELELNIRAADRWTLQDFPDPTNLEGPKVPGGEYLPAGTDQAIAGFRGDLGLIDDPVKGREQAMSATQMDKIWDWYRFDFRPRLKPGARQLLIMTRWVENDLAGRLLEEEGDRWRMLSLPMIAEDDNDPLRRRPGERLWPEWFTDEMVADAQSDPVLWLSLYQQRPTAEQGTFFKRDWLHPVDPKHVPKLKELRVYGGSDYAVSVKNTADYTAHVVIGIDAEDRPWLLEVWRGRTTSETWIDVWCDMVNDYKPLMWAEEKGQILSGIGPYLERRQRERHAWTVREQFVSRADKGVRAQSIRGYIATHGLWYAKDAPWRAAFEQEMLSFPGGRNDDQVDGLGLIGQLLDMALKAPKPVKPTSTQQSGYRRTGPADSVSSSKVI